MYTLISILHNKTGVYRISPLLFLLFFFQGIRAQDHEKDSLISALKTAPSDTDKVNILHRLGIVSVNDSDILMYAEQSLVLAEKLCESPNKDEARVGKKNKANSLHDIGFVIVNRGDVEKGLGYMKKSLKIWEEINDKWGLAMTLNNIGYIYHNQGLLEKALEYYFQSLKLREEIKDKKGMAYNLNNIGFIYHNLHQPEKTIEYYLKALKIRESEGDKLGMGSSLHNIGFIYQERTNSMHNRDSITKQLQVALGFYTRGLKLRRETGDLHGTANSLNSIGNVFQSEAKICNNKDTARALTDKALDYYLQALKIREQISDKKGMSNSIMNAGLIYFEQGKLDVAEKYCQSSLKLAREVGFPSYIRDAANALFSIYKKQKKFEQALEMHVIYKQMADSINSQENHKTTLKKQLQYDFEKQQEASAALQEKKDAVAEKEKQNQMMIRNFFIGGFVIVFFLSLFIFRGYRQKQKANLVILKQKEEVEKAKATIEIQKIMVEEKQKEIVDSIYYARRIQRALITSERYIHKCLEKLNSGT